MLSITIVGLNIVTNKIRSQIYHYITNIVSIYHFFIYCIDILTYILEGSILGDFPL